MALGVGVIHVNCYLLVAQATHTGKHINVASTIDVAPPCLRLQRCSGLKRWHLLVMRQPSLDF